SLEGPSVATTNGDICIVGGDHQHKFSRLKLKPFFSDTELRIELTSAADAPPMVVAPSPPAGPSKSCYRLPYGPRRADRRRVPMSEAQRERVQYEIRIRQERLDHDLHFRRS